MGEVRSAEDAEGARFAAATGMGGSANCDLRGAIAGRVRDQGDARPEAVS